MADPREHQDAIAARIDPSSWDELPVGLFAFDLAGRIISYNDAFLGLLDVSATTELAFERCTSPHLNLVEASHRVLSGETVRVSGWFQAPNRPPRFIRATMSPSA
ncbi:hypothetical protein, partial [Exiguobacterium sp.]|uniref:hypothetical protein n=1 Tax=Exiguobacterium sp. TaxID=44751 RepID=UPI00263B80B4